MARRRSSTDGLLIKHSYSTRTSSRYHARRPILSMNHNSPSWRSVSTSELSAAAMHSFSAFVVLLSIFRYTGHARKIAPKDYANSLTTIRSCYIKYYTLVSHSVLCKSGKVLLHYVNNDKTAALLFSWQ